MLAAAALGLLLVFGFAQPGLAQNTTNQLNLFKNYFVTGDYVVAGWQKTGFSLISNVSYGTGNINVPDTFQASKGGIAATPIPDGASIVAAFLYWQTVEDSGTAGFGQNGFFNNYAIKGTPLGNPNAPAQWSSGGCAGANTGSKTVRTYRADVRPYLLHLDPQSGKIQFNGTYPVVLRDTGGNQPPFTLGASIVIVYRLLGPTDPTNQLAVPLNAITIYDGSFTMNNSVPNLNQLIQGFYQAASSSPKAKLTHIVGGGQPNKFESVSLNNLSLLSLYGTNASPFPGLYTGVNAAWDSPTWIVNAALSGNDSSATALVAPSSSNPGCVGWGATVFSTTVQDSDGDGLLDVWEDNQGYTDVNTGQFVALPGAYKFVKDIFVEVDYLQNLDLNAGPYKHSHLPKQGALDKVGDALKNAPVSAAAGCDPLTHACHGINVHFDLGLDSSGHAIYSGDPYVVPGGTGGNAIPESVTLCSDNGTPPLCAFPGTPVVGWKGGFQFIKQNASVPNSTPPIPLGNFQPGRGQSYHYVLFGHALGAPRSSWGTSGTTVSNPAIPKLISIMNSGTVGMVSVQSPQGFLKPGDCPGDSRCNGVTPDRVTVTGALGQTALNGTYSFSSPSTDPNTNITTFTITTSNVANGTYNFNNEPQLSVSYGGPTTTSGRSDGGGGDSTVTFGLWPADDPLKADGITLNCQPDPSQPLGSFPAYCTNQVGTITAEAGTLLHEIGHSLTLTHGGTYYDSSSQSPYLPTSHGLNCKPNFLSVMNYLFQVRGFPDTTAIDYSGQLLNDLNEGALDEGFGIGAVAHLTRWYAPPNATSGDPATAHCDGTPILDGAKLVRVNATAPPSPMIDWNNDQIVPDAVNPQDVNFNGTPPNGASSPVDSPFHGFNDWAPANLLGGTLFGNGIDLRQVGSRANTLGFSSGGDLTVLSGGDLTVLSGGDLTVLSGGDLTVLSGGDLTVLSGGDLTVLSGEQDFDTANSTVDAPTLNSAIWNKSTKAVDLNWSYGFGQVRKVFVCRMLGAFTVPDSCQKPIQTLSGSPPPTTFSDTTVKPVNTYTYFLKDEIVPDPGKSTGRKSGPSNLITVTTK